MNRDYDLICVGMALVDSIIKGFDPKPISASGPRFCADSVRTEQGTWWWMRCAAAGWIPR